MPNYVWKSFGTASPSWRLVIRITGSENPAAEVNISLKIYLFEWKNDRDTYTQKVRKRQREERERIFRLLTLQWLQWLSMDQAKGRNQELHPGVSCLMWVAQAVGSHSTAFAGALARNCIRSRTVVTQTGIQKWDSLTCYATVLAM